MRKIKEIWKWFWNLDTEKIHPKIPPIQIIVLLIVGILIYNFVKKIF